MNRYLMWLCLFFVIGILAFCPVAEKPVIYISIAFGIGFLVVCLFKRKVIFPLLLCAAFVLGAYVMVSDAAKDHTFSPWTDGKRIVCGRVLDSYISGEYAVSVVDAESVDYREVKGRIKLYVKNGSMPKSHAKKTRLTTVHIISPVVFMPTVLQTAGRYVFLKRGTAHSALQNLVWTAAAVLSKG